MNASNTPEYAWNIPGCYPPTMPSPQYSNPPTMPPPQYSNPPTMPPPQYSNHSYPPPCFAPQPAPSYPYAPVPVNSVPPAYSQAPPYAGQVPYQPVFPPFPACQNQQPFNGQYLDQRFGEAVSYEAHGSKSTAQYSNSITSASAPSAPPPPCAPARPAPPIPPNPKPNGSQTFPQTNYNKINSEPPGIGFSNPSSNQSLYPSLNTSDFRKSSNKVTPLPPNLILLWESSKAAKIYFVQPEGHVVSTGEDLKLRANKFPVMSTIGGHLPPGSLSGDAKGATLLVTMENAWRLGLSKERSYLVKGSLGELAFYDSSTSPARYVVVILPKETTKEDRQRLIVLLQASARVVDEPSNVVDKIETGVESAFDYLTQSMDSLVKKGTPTTVHKNTKWLRKGTGNLVRLGGGLVSKGVHLVSDNVMEKEAPKDSRAEHKELFEALRKVREAIENKSVTTVLPL